MLAEEILRSGITGPVATISARTREHWGGIFKAHPWLSGPADSYLGFWQRGGGAAGEHSHAINIWQHFAHVLGAGRVAEVSATMDIVKEAGTEYDRLCFITLKSEERPCRRRHPGCRDAADREILPHPGPRRLSSTGGSITSQAMMRYLSGKGDAVDGTGDRQDPRR